MNEIKIRVREKILSLITSNNADRYFIELILDGSTELDNELREQNEDDLRFLFSNALPENCRIGKVKIQTTGNLNREIFRRENIFAADLHKSFSNESAENFPSGRG